MKITVKKKHSVCGARGANFKQRILCAILFSVLLVLLFRMAALELSPGSHSLRSDEVGCKNEVFHTSSSVESGAESESVADGLSERLSELFSDFLALLPGDVADDPDSLFDMLGYDSLMERVTSSLFGEGSRVLGFFGMLIGVALLFALCESCGFSQELSSAAVFGVSCVASIPIFVGIYPICLELVQSISTGCDFFSGFIPIATAITAIGGGARTAAAEGAGMTLALGFVSGVLLKNLIPIALLMFVLALVQSFDGESAMGGVCTAVKNLFTAVLGFVSFLLPTTLALQTMIGGARDSIALRGAKYAVGNMLPIVGSTVSGLLSGLISGVHALSNTVGALSVGVIIIILFLPVAELLLYRLAFQVALTFVDFVGLKMGRRIFSSCLSALDSMIAVGAMGGVIFLFEIIIFIRAVVSI